MTDHDLRWDLAIVQFGMVLCVWVIVVQWTWGMCLPPCSALGEIYYQSTTNQNYKKEYMCTGGRDLKGR
jgi:hypothetical protein